MEAKPFQVPSPTGSSNIVTKGVENEIIKLRHLMTFDLFTGLASKYGPEAAGGGAEGGQCPSGGHGPEGVADPGTASSTQRSNR